MIGGIAVGVFLFRIDQRPPSGKAVLDAMPVANTWLSELPAEKNSLRSEQTRKIDQSLFHSFAHATMAMDFLDLIFDLLYQFRDLIVSAQLFHKIRRVGVELLVTNDGFTLDLEPPQIFENSLDNRAQDGQQQVGLIDRKQPGKIGGSFHRQKSDSTLFPARAENAIARSQSHHNPSPFLSSRRSAMLSEWPVIWAVIAPRSGLPSR